MLSITDLAVLCALLFALACGLFAIAHSRLCKRITLLDWSILGMGGVYGLGWIIVLLVTTEGGNQTWSERLLPYSNYFLIHTLCVVVLAFSVCFGWMFAGTFLKRYHKPKIFITSIPTNRALHTACWMLLVTAFFMQWIYVKPYGGLLGLLDYSAEIRSGIFTVENSFSFLKPFGMLALPASFGFFGLWLVRRASFLMILGLTISIIFSLYILFSNLGRIGFIIYLTTFLLGYIMYKRPRPSTLLVFGAAIPILVLGGAYAVSVWLSIKSADNIGEFLARELSFPFASFFAQIDSGQHIWRGFYDFFVAPVYLLPSSWWKDIVENVGQVNTALIMGAPKGESGVTGAIPVDLVTLGLMQAHIFGVVIVGCIFGILLRTIQFWVDSISESGIRAVFESYIILKISLFAIFYSHPALFIAGNFNLLITVILFWLVLNKSRICIFRHNRAFR